MIQGGDVEGVLQQAADEFNLLKEEAEKARDTLTFAIQAAFDAGMSKIDIARTTGVSRPTIDSWLNENGETE